MSRTRNLSSSTSLFVHSRRPSMLGQPVLRASWSPAGGGVTLARSRTGWESGQSQHTCAKCAASLPHGQLG
eukprot:3716152-Alexandrium_andersonii.AAC.1